MNEQVRGPEWRPDADETADRNRRGWSIEELRKKLGVAAPEAREKPRASEPQTDRPRIVRRGMAPALA